MAHGGTSARKARGVELGRHFNRRQRPHLTSDEHRDRMLRALPWSGKVELADAMIQARESRDPLVLTSARERLRQKYRKRFVALGVEV